MMMTIRNTKKTMIISIMMMMMIRNTKMTMIRNIRMMMIINMEMMMIIIKLGRRLLFYLSQPTLLKLIKLLISLFSVMVLNLLRNKFVEIVVNGILGRTGLNVINPVVVFNIADNYVAVKETILLVLQFILIPYVLEFLLQKPVLVMSLAALGPLSIIGHLV
jgi:hypothetical protein